MDRQSTLTKLGFAVLAFYSALAVYSSWGNAGSIAFVLGAVMLVLLFLCLHEFEERACGGDFRGAYGQYSALAKMGFAVFTCNSALAIHDPARADAVALVLASYAALVALTWQFLRNFGNNAHGRGVTLLFLCLREFERARGGVAARTRNIKAAVWTLTTLLTGMFASRVAPLMQPAVVWVMAVERARGGDGAARNNMDSAYSALARVGIAVLACNAALDAYDGRRDDTLSEALVLVSFSSLVILMGLFVRALARAHGGGHGQGY
ncbi:unnamed protein product [Urochloa humidicola]